MATIAIGGGTGSVGSVLTSMLEANGHKVLILSRKKGATPNTVYWNPVKKELDYQSLEGVDTIINLAGAGIADRLWTKKYKKLIIESRVAGNALLADHIAKGHIKPTQFISASAIGIYGDRGTELLDETSTPGQEGFLAETCKEWEASVTPIQELGVNTAILRIGIVLFDGGALGKMLPSYHFRVGSYFGDGSQYYSWIHIEDVARMFMHVMQQELTGTFNAVAPNPVTNKVFAQTIGKVKSGSHLILPVPSFGLKLAMGEMSSVVLDGSKVSSKKIQDTSFEFSYPELSLALRDLVS